MRRKTMQETDKCFVVMPFGIKPKNDGSGGTYNFDKVYRVIIQRAIRDVNMKPLRADETEGSRIIHADMFKDLRDRPVVLVDLSLLNPNVFYELGIRHVMSPTGTVLIANEETVKRLPFDIALSRTIAYKYDGKFLDWDEVERVVPQLAAAIEEARSGTPDSPVYAFLEQVLSPQPQEEEDNVPDEEDNLIDNLDEFQDEFAKTWLAQDNIELNELIKKHGNHRFGVRAIGYYGLSNKIQLQEKKEIAGLLYNHGQYDLAAKLYGEMNEAKKLEFEDILNYGSSVSREKRTIQSARDGLEIIEKARELAKQKIEQEPSNTKYQMDISYATQKYGNMLARIWERYDEDDDAEIMDVIQKVINAYQESIQMIENLLEEKKHPPLGRYAQNLLRLTIFFRIAEKDRNRQDIEKNFHKMLSLEADKDQPEISKSYLRWYKVFALADMGKFDDAQNRAMAATALDTEVKTKDPNSEIGRRQYSLLRGFLEQYSRYWQDPKSIARISQLISYAHLRR